MKDPISKWANDAQKRNSMKNSDLMPVMTSKQYKSETIKDLNAIVYWLENASSDYDLDTFCKALDDIKPMYNEYLKTKDNDKSKVKGVVSTTV